MDLRLKRKSAAKLRAEQRKKPSRIINLLLILSLLSGNFVGIPTGAAEVIAYCGVEAHEHSEVCYTAAETLICGVTEENHIHAEECRHSEATLNCGITEQVHEHADECYTDTETLICEEHVHTEGCWQPELVQTCQDVTEGHEHETEVCYEVTDTLVCEYPDAAHEHAQECWQTESVLNCDLHEHTEACGTVTETLLCGVTEENHVHTEECKQMKPTLTCEQEIHIHELNCYSNPEADVEDASDWENTLPKERTGDWRKDLLAVVKSQLGYRESVENYQVEVDGESLSGYNRYGAWWSKYTRNENQAYKDWNVTFLIFCLNYADISFMDFPMEETCEDWIASLAAYELYFAADAYTPTAGDMVFVDTDGDGTADRVGVVTERGETELAAIEGDADGEVAEVIYDLAVSSEKETERILGYSDMSKAQADTKQENENSIALFSDTITWTAGSSVLYLDASADLEWRYGTRFWYKTTGTDAQGTIWTGISMTNNGNGAYSVVIPEGMDLTNSEFRFGRYNSNNNLAGETDNLSLNSFSNAYVVNNVQQTDTGWEITGEWKASSTDTPDTPEITDATLYLDTSALLNSSSGTWEKDGAVIRLGYRTENNEWKEIDVTSTSGNVHSFALPEDMDKTKPIQFLRKNPSDLNNNPWNSTGDLYMVAGSATFILDDWSYGHWDIAVTEVDTIPEPVEGKQRVFYDATLSKLVYTDDNGSAAIPVGASKVIYCTYSGSESGTILMTKLTSYTKGSNIWNDVYFVDIPSGATNVRFHSGSAVSSGGDTTADAASAIPSGLTNPCFYGDTGDTAVYDNANRGGYWAEAFTIRSNTGVVDITSAEFVPESGKLYVNTSFYDFYSDYELNRQNRDNYPQIEFKQNRTLVSFRQLDQALSSYYNAGSVNCPLYVGDFDPGSDGRSAASSLNLYGFNGGSNDFYAINNGWLDKYRGEGKSFFATQGLVDNNLRGTTLTTSGSAFPLFSESFLSGNNSKNTKLGNVYRNVAFPFTKQPLTAGSGTVDYWVFDSANTTLSMQRDTSGQYYLQSVGNNGRYTNFNEGSGFFPFNSGAAGGSSTYNYGFGARFDLTFRLTDDGCITNNVGEKTPIVFNFSGDDDVWVFIDGKLALDVGGSHGAVAGYLNFQTMQATVQNVKSAGSVESEQSPRVTPFSLAEGSSKTDEHTLTMFYMERGLYDSNMCISFNFPDENMLEVEKEVDESDVNVIFDGMFDETEFTFNIKNQATHYGAYKPPVDNASVFDIQQVNIKDYGSATTGKLENAEDAAYSSSKRVAKASSTVDADGNFTVLNNEVANFHNQFRRGSYIYLKEELSPAQSALYDTTWTMYDNNIAVTSMISDDTVSITEGTDMTNVSSTVVNDGRTEIDSSNRSSGYYGQSPGNSFVFRSYTDPDSSMTTKLKVVFTNKVKTGSLTISKAQDADSGDLVGDFTFYVVFSNVGGMDLEGENNVTVGPLTLKVGDSTKINGIPMNTEYAIYEIKLDGDITLARTTRKVGAAGTDESLTYVEEKYGESDAFKTTGVMSEDTADGVEKTEHCVTYYNTNQLDTNLSITVTKQWQDGKGNALTENLPGEVKIQLQCSTDNWITTEDVGEKVTLPQDGKWEYTYEDLPEKDDKGNAYTYRVVEVGVDGNNRISLAGNDYVVSYGELTQSDTASVYTQTITNTLIPKVLIDITKLDATDTTKKLGGVEFKLEKQGDGDTWNAVGEPGTTDANGFLRFAGLKPGTYRLTETKTAKGYSLLKAPIEITISKEDDGTYEVDVTDFPEAKLEADGNHYKLSLTIYNQKSLEMPATGGIHGFEFWILGGLCIMAVPLLMYTLVGYKKGGKYLRK